MKRTIRPCHLGRCEVGAVDVRAVYDDGNALFDAVLGDEVADVVHRGEDETAVRCQQQVLHALATLQHDRWPLCKMCS